MKQTRSHRATCRKKRRFGSEGAAYAFLRELIRANLVDPGTEPYRCTACGDWHVGHRGGQATKSLERLIREGAGS